MSMSRVPSLLILAAIGSGCATVDNMQSGRPDEGSGHAPARTAQWQQLSTRKLDAGAGASIIEFGLTNGPHNARESTIAVQRNDPLHAVAAIMGNASHKGIDIASTFDGGQSWELSSIPQATGAVFEADPMIAIDAMGIAYLAHIPVDSFSQTNLGIDIHRSLDGGSNWSFMTRLTNDVVPRDARDDKVAIAVDDHPSSPFFGNVYVAWKLPPGPIFFARSSDQGETWTGPLRLASVGVAGLDLATADDGTVLLSYNQGFANGTTRLNIQVYRSSNAGDNWQPPAQIALNRAAFSIQPAGACTAPGAHLQTSLGVRPSTHPSGSAIWVSWNDYLPGVPASCSATCGASNSCRSGVYLSRSDDSGATWSAPERVPGLDPIAGDQFFSWADVDPFTGDLLVGFKDTAGDPNRLLADVVLRRSRDGITWDPPVTVSAVASNTTSTFKGDYQSIAAAGARTYLAWPDYRNRSLGDFYVATVIFDELSADGFEGAWFNPEQPGQGLLLDQRGDPPFSFAAWFTFDTAESSSKIGDPGQRWFSLQAPVTGSDLALQIYSSSGPGFMQPVPADTVAVGSARLRFYHCLHGELQYQFDDGRSGTIALTRLAAPATGCPAPSGQRGGS